MSGSRLKKLRAAFELKYGFDARHRKTAIYKTHWRKFKKSIMR